MDLKSGCIFWPRAGDPPPAHAPLSRDVACDVAVIGAGITGALLADRLSADGLRVVVLDRRAVCTGSTPASTGLLQYEIDTSLVDLSGHVGPDHARRAYEASFRSLADFRTLVAGLDDDCGLTPRHSLYLASEPGDVADLRAEQNARAAIGIGVELLTASDLRRDFGIARPAALWSPVAMEVDPYRLALSLLRCAVGRGVEVHANTTVTSYDADDSGVTLGTEIGDDNDGGNVGDGDGNDGGDPAPRRWVGPRVRARHVAFATGYETPQFLGPALDGSPCALKSTYALVSQSLPDFGPWHSRCLIWESGRPYFYARTTPDGRAMMGGADDDFADPARRDARIDAKSRVLVAKFAGLFPSLAIEPVCCWAGTFAETKDGLPYIGAVPDFRRGLFALGYGGNGITFSLIASGIIADLVAGRPNPDAELFRFGR